MKIIFLGTNGWFDTKTGDTICILISTDREYIILDAGNGIYKIDRYITDEKPVYLFLSHFHLDHIFGIHILSKFRFSQGLKICGPEGTSEVLNQITDKKFTMPLNNLPYPVEIIEMPDEKNKIPFGVESEPLIHSSLTLGYRLSLENKIIAYCPDTGFCENAVKLARNSDLLITECAYKIGQRNSKWPHLNPEDAARLAVEAAAKKLALVHFDAYFYQTLEERKNAALHAKTVFSNTIAAVDDMEIEV